MLLTVLSVVLILVAGGCVCVFWAARGGPRWTHGVAKATLAAAHVTTALRPGRPGSRGGSNADDGGSD